MLQLAGMKEKRQEPRSGGPQLELDATSILCTLLSCSACLPTGGRKDAHTISPASKKREAFFLPSLTHPSHGWSMIDTIPFPQPL